MKKINWGRLNHEKELIRKAGYIIYEEKPWHWEVTRQDSRVLVHVWPTVGKYMTAFDSASSLYENNIVGALDKCFNPDLKREVTPEQEEAMKEVQKFRNTFFDGIDI